MQEKKLLTRDKKMTVKSICSCSRLLGKKNKRKFEQMIYYYYSLQQLFVGLEKI